MSSNAQVIIRAKDMTTGAFQSKRQQVILRT